MNTWDKLTQFEKAEVMKIALDNGIYNLDTIRDAYNEFAQGGSIHIDPSKKGTFTAAASKHNMGVQEFASKVLANKEDYSPAMVKKANFARNASKWHSYGGNLYAMGGDVDNEEGNEGLFGNKTIDTVTSYLPIIGTVQDAYNLYKNPSWENAGWFALSLGSDLLGAGMLKGVKALGKGVKAARQTEKVAKEALDTHRKTTRNLISRSIREEDRRLVRNYEKAKTERVLKEGQHFWEKAVTYPIYGGWVGADAGINTMQNTQKALGGNIFAGGGYGTWQL